jgi:hypothetical protein
MDRAGRRLDLTAGIVFDGVRIFSQSNVPDALGTLKKNQKEAKMNRRRMGYALAAGLIWMIVAVVPVTGQDKPLTAPAAQENSLRIEQAVICREVADRNPVQAGELFPSHSGELVCFTRVLGAIRETQITHNWYYQGALKASIQLPVRAANWRTWSKKTIHPEWTGEWMVEVLGENGTPLESVIFTVQ